MTIRLLSTYDGFAPQSIITLDSALEASLIAGGNATATLTGGTVAYRERQPVMIQPAVPKRGTVSLIANRKAIVPLTEGSALTITPTAGTTGTYQRYDASGAAVGALTTIGAAPLTIGAFEGDFTVEIKCTTGSLVAKTADAVLRVVQTSRPANTWVALGDSMTGQATNPLVADYGSMTPPLPTSTTFPAVVSFNDRGTIAWANVFLNGQMQLLRNAGVGSNRVEHILARMDADALSLSPKYVSVMAGYNNIVNSDTTANITAVLGTIFDKILASGAILLACTILPNATQINAVPAKLVVYNQVNNFIKNYCAANAGAYLIDVAESFLDITTGGELSGYYQVDNIHPVMKGSIPWGQYFAARVLQIIGLKSSPLPTSPLDLFTNFKGGNMLTGGRMVGTGGTNTGTGMSGSVATGWTHQLEYGTATSVASKVARTDGVQGEWQQIAVSSVTASSAVRLQKTITVASGAFAIGETIGGSMMEVAVDAVNAVSSLQLIAQVQNSSFADIEIHSCMLNGPASVVTPFGTALFQIPDFVIPALTNHIVFKLIVTLAIGSTITLRAGRAACRNLS